MDYRNFFAKSPLAFKRVNRRSVRTPRIGNCDEIRFFTGLRPSEQIALLVTDYDAARGVLSVTKAEGSLRRDKDRTKTQEDRYVELCPRALEVLSLRRHLALREKYVAAGGISHQHLFFPPGRMADQRPGDHPPALERELKGARYSPARPLPRASFLRDLALMLGKFALGRKGSTGIASR